MTRGPVGGLFVATKVIVVLMSQNTQKSETVVLLPVFELHVSGGRVSRWFLGSSPIDLSTPPENCNAEVSGPDRCVVRFSDRRRRRRPTACTASLPAGSGRQGSNWQNAGW